MARNKKEAQRASQLKGTSLKKDAKNDLLDDIIAFLTPYYNQRRVPKRLVNVVILIRSAFPGRSIDKAFVKKAYAKAGWDASVLCNLTNNELADAIESGELDKSYDEAPIRVEPVPKRPRKESNKIDASQKIPPQPATGSRLGFPEGYFETTYIAGPQTRYGKAYPSMFYNDIEKELKAKKALPKAGRGSSKVPLAVPSSNVNNGTSFKDANDPCRIIAAKHARHQHERVMIRKTPLGVKSILDIVTKLNNKKDMPTKLNRVRDLIRSENPGVMVRTSMITKAYQRIGMSKKNRRDKVVAGNKVSALKPTAEFALSPGNFKHKTIKPSHRAPERLPKRNKKSRNQLKVSTANNRKRREPVKYATAEKFYGTVTARKHRTMREAAEAALEERKQRDAINKKLSVAMRRLNSRRKTK